MNTKVATELSSSLPDATRLTSSKVRRFRLAAIGIGLSVGLLMTETALWVLRPVEHPYRGKALEVAWNIYASEPFQPGQTVLHPDPEVLPGTLSPSRFTINEFGFRSPRLQSISKASNELRIFCLGGSTTECLYLDDEHAWPEQLLNRLEPARATPQTMDVINCGVSGYTTREHIATLAQRIVPLRPDIVLILAGTNDLRMQLITEDYDILRRDSRSRHTLRSPEPGDSRELAKVALSDVSQLVRRFVWLKRSWQTTDHRGNPIQDLEGRWYHEERVRGSKLPYGHLPSDVSTTEFEQNLRTLVGICRSQNATPVLITQPSLMRANMSERELWLCADCIYQNERIRPEEYRALLDRFNDAVLRVADESDSVVIDLAREISGRGEWFYDSCHFNVAGSHRVADVIHQGLMASPEIRKRLQVE
jgi:lysophospholipase L1-like esterase